MHYGDQQSKICSSAGDALSAYVLPAVLANAANLNRTWVTKASQLGLVNISTLDGEDLIVLRVFAFVDQLVWPGERRSRSVSRGMEPWQSLAVNAARDAARDPATTLDSILWITPEGVELTHSPGAHSNFVLDHQGSIFVSLPIGEWIAELPPNLETVFHWPRQLTASKLTVDGNSEVSLVAFSTIPMQVTVFVASDSVIQDAAHAAVKKHILTQQPGTSIRIIERQPADGTSVTTQWCEVYELPKKGLVKRPLAFKSLLDEFGPQIRQFGRPQEGTPRRRERR
ncbi:hypothetical protein [Streptomyces sp. NPDC015125]|uniref:hypothetical protein n=1 Tax=Streptomyces sp. NPDC015125 TaxID=3364938 RepID=UPI0036FF050E